MGNGSIASTVARDGYTYVFDSEVGADGCIRCVCGCGCGDVYADGALVEAVVMLVGELVRLMVVVAVAVGCFRGC